MNLTPEEIETLKKDPIYRYYSETQWSTFTAASVQAHLDAITKTTVEALPLIKFLIMIKQSKELDYLSAIDADTSYLANMDANLRNLNDELGYPDGSLRLEGDYLLEENTHTLAGGALANSVVVTNTAGGLTSHLLWIIWCWDTAPAAAYTFDFHENAGAANARNLTLVPADNGNRRVFLYWNGLTADTNLEASIAGGAGAEVLTSIAYWTEF